MDAAPESGSAPLTLHGAAARHGAYRWVEHRLFELTGAWAAAPGTTAAARLHLFEASAQHGWHAQLWAERLPVLAGADPGARTRPLGDVVGPLLDALGRPRAWPEEGAALRFLAGLHLVVLPRLAASYRGHRRRLAPVSDAPSLRALAFVLGDLEEEMGAGEVLLREATADAAARRVVAEAEAELGALAGDVDLVPEGSTGAS